MLIKSAKDLKVYQKAYKLAMEVFHLTKDFPKEERYSLTDQVRRSSRSVCANLREAWAKRKYEAHFVSKLTDCDGENGETETWLDFAVNSAYLCQDDYEQLVGMCSEVGAMLGAMINDPTPFIRKPAIGSQRSEGRDQITAVSTQRSDPTAPEESQSSET